ncbi:UDP-N-acetylglucosamine 2-epimerase [Lacrimispora sp.]|uniref:UDP-N-acetylglucosamine 2-epimerase n=1 Tax=Lacrimispora sp. TaxID=2719234 RepID=UPI0028AF8D53|nr:UDP-N-acetylglucosamine 2-epimerase [Lacrimispora sp.]
MCDDLRKIAVLTGTRAEYGVMKNILRKIEKSNKLQLLLIVTGTHLSKRYGHTIDEIVSDGFTVAEEISLQGDFSENMRVPREMALLIQELSACFNALSPDILMLCGDRYEALAAASVAVGMHIPIAHISGGESTEGAMDEQIRHAITKMAHIHFPGATVYAGNIRNMGEEAWRVFEVGDPGIENIRCVKMLSREGLEQELNIAINRQTLLVTYHPVTLERDQLAWQVDNLIQALKKHDGTKVITYPNSDDGSEVIIDKLNQYAKEDERVRFLQSLGSSKYLSVMKYCGAVIGNSSSAIIESPYMHIPTVNIGNRQKGRLMADSIISCGYEVKEISAAIEKALSSQFYDKVKKTKSIYGDGNTSEQIVRILEEIEIDEKLIKKKLQWGD